MSRWIDFDYAVIRIVPCAYRTPCVPVGVVLHAPTERRVVGRFVTDLFAALEAVPDLPPERLRRYLESLGAIVKGEAGPLSDLSASERFHWLTAPRSDLLQPGPCHPGRTRDLDATLAKLFDSEVLGHR